MSGVLYLSANFEDFKQVSEIIMRELEKIVKYL